MKFTLSPLKKMLKKHWRLLLVLIVVLILSFYLYRTYYLEGNTVAEMITNKRLNDLEAAVKQNESEPEPGTEPGSQPGTDSNLTDREKEKVEEIKNYLLTTYYGVEQNPGNSEVNDDLSDETNALTM